MKDEGMKGKIMAEDVPMDVLLIRCQLKEIGV